jgi:ectoine hydroxylase-related dioxygenase (phytanoyl-CoA dioxygenase family)
VAEAKAGDCVLFDLRMLHRGGANTGRKKRPVMYLTYTQEWWVDAVNFNTKQTADFDKLNPKLRKLVSRIDSQSYTEQLEGMLRERGVDVAALQSGYDFNKVVL